MPQAPRTRPRRQSLLALIAHSTRLAEVLPQLHQRALDATGGRSSLLLEYDSRLATFQAASGLPQNRPRTAPIQGPEEPGLLQGCFDSPAPTIVANLTAQAPGLAAWLEARAAILLPISHGRHRAGVLAVGFSRLPPKWRAARPSAAMAGEVMEIADAFLAALDLARLRRREEFGQAIRTLLHEFAAGLTASLNLAAGLDTVCRSARRIFGAHRTTIWMHDRDARQLVLEVSAGPAQHPRGFRIGADDPAVPAAAAMRRLRAEVLPAGSEATGRTVTIPLRGWRRALGVVVFDGVEIDAGEDTEMVDRCSELGRQLSTAIESMQLLEAMIGSHAGRAPGKSRAGQPHGDREHARRRATHAERLPALGVFVAGVAHELNNPLQGVLGHLELLRTTGAFPKHLRREVQTIYREADRAARIVRNLLVFSGSRRLSRRRVSMNVVMQKVAALRRTACRALNIEIVRHYDDHLPRVQSDPLLLHQVFLNIVMNAEQAISSAGRPGRIELTTRAVDSGTRVMATVHDTGNGIAPDDLHRVFEPFYTTKEVGQGTGLGLAIAYGIVNEHGGQITAANAPEGGAVFTVELPALPVRGGHA